MQKVRAGDQLREIPCVHVICLVHGEKTMDSKRSQDFSGMARSETEGAAAMRTSWGGGGAVGNHADPLMTYCLYDTVSKYIII